MLDERLAFNRGRANFFLAFLQEYADFNLHHKHSETVEFFERPAVNGWLQSAWGSD
jgi:hypothetical protein